MAGTLCAYDSRVTRGQYVGPNQPATEQTRLATWVLLVVMIAPAMLYAGSGILNGFLEADDFGWLSTARDQRWHYIFSFGSHDHFYRPVIRAWFFGMVRMCQDSTTCYHSLNLSVHVINTMLFTALSMVITRDRVFSSLAAIVFAVSPGYIEAVAWVSAITELLSTLFFLTTTLLVCRAALKPSAINWYVAAFAAMLALFAHEASAVLFAVIPLVLWLSGRLGELKSRHVWSFVFVGALFFAAVMFANHRNVIFTEGRYTVGWHMIRQALDYLVSMYVGPHRWTGRLFAAIAAIAILAAGPPMARAGIIWIVLTLLPFLGFTWGNSSRYLYLPTMGFGWIVAALLLALRRRLIETTSYRPAAVVASVLAAIIIGRFSVFTSRGIRTQLESSAVYREYAEMVIARGLDKKGTNEIVVPAPRARNYDRASIQPMLRWTLKRPDLIVIVE